jgi:hypothetical protein
MDLWSGGGAKEPQWQGHFPELWHPESLLFAGWLACEAMSRTQLQVWVDGHEDYAAFLSC